MTWRITRLNGDATWHLATPSGAVLFDPWLIGSEIDVALWFHEASHTEPVLPVDDVPAGLVIVSQPFADHCHPVTLAALDRPIAAVPQAQAHVGAPSTSIPAWGTPPLRHDSLRIWRITRPWWQPPRYHAIVVATPDDRCAIHAPHGLDPRDAGNVAAELQVELLATSRMHYRLPAMLGGAVNPGPEAADRARAACGARHGLVIHDEAKHETGLIARIARIQRDPCPADWLAPPVGVPTPLPDPP